MILKKGSKLYSIIKFKCPHCHEGEFFIRNNPYKLKYAGDLHKSCSVCQKKYSYEPGFYFGAMYISYGLGVTVFLSIVLILYLFFPSINYIGYIWAVLIAMLVLGPYLYALSKIIWANLFFKFDPDNKEQFKK